MEAVINRCRALRLLRRSDLLLMMVLPRCNRRRPLWDLISKNFKREKNLQTSNIFPFARMCQKMLIVRREKVNKLAFSSLFSPWGADDEGRDEGEDVWFIFGSFGNRRRIDCRPGFFFFFVLLLVNCYYCAFVWACEAYQCFSRRIPRLCRTSCLIHAVFLRCLFEK